MRFSFFAILAFAFAFPRLAEAQSVHWDPPRGSLPVGQSTALALIFEDCTPKAVVPPPKVEGLTLQFYGQTENTSVVNFSVSRTVTLTYAALLARKQSVDIPAFDVETDKGKVHVAAAHFDPTGATVGGTGRSLDSAASAKLTVVPGTVWAGEVFDLVTSVEASHNYSPQFQRNFDWTADPLLAEGWSNPEQADFTTGGEQHDGFAFRSRAVARVPGTIKLNPANHIVNLSVGVTGFGFFQQRQYSQYSITSNTPILEVKSLPPPPAGFTGAVGQFKLNSKIVPATAAIGEPVTWTLDLSGTGNWPDIAGLPSRDVSKDFNVVQPQARRTPAEGKLFDVALSEDVVLVPTKAGNYVLGPINFVYFDPKSGGYKTISTPRTTVTITAPEPPKSGISPTVPAESANPQTTASGPGGTGLSGTPPPIPTTPSGIPRDPMTGAAEAWVPWTVGRLTAAVAIPFGALALCWIGLALRRARQTDPTRARREARARLAATLAALRTAGAAERPKLLLQWQHDTTALWEIAHAAPPPHSFSDTAWSALWKDSDRALYGADHALPADWIDRADRAFTTKRAPGFIPLRLFQPGNLLPFLFVLACAAMLFPVALRAQDPAAAYRSGDFPSAEKISRETVAKQPVDWIARYNLSLALAQQDRWNEAAAHATAAFVQHPEDPAVRWHFALVCDKAGFAPGPLADFVRPGPLQLLATRASSAEWERVLVASAGGMALAVGLMLFNAYRSRRSRSMSWTATALLVAAAGFGAVAFCGNFAYGRTADARAVIAWRAGTLRSIPTEADTSQKTVPLAAGSVAVVDKVFLDWVRLSFENGQTGWVRKDEVVGLWK